MEVSIYKTKVMFVINEQKSLVIGLSSWVSGDERVDEEIKKRIASYNRLYFALNRGFTGKSEGEGICIRFKFRSHLYVLIWILDAGLQA